MSRHKFEEQLAEFVEEIYKAHGNHHVHGVVISETMAQSWGVPFTPTCRAVTINTPTGPVVVTVGHPSYADMTKAAEDLKKRLGDVTHDLEVAETRLAETKLTLADSNRDRDSYRIRLEHLQRSVQGIADSMNYSLPGGVRR